MNVFTCVVVPFVSTCPPHMFSRGQLHDLTFRPAQKDDVISGGQRQVPPGEFGLPLCLGVSHRSCSWADRFCSAAEKAAFFGTFGVFLADIM